VAVFFEKFPGILKLFLAGVAITESLSKKTGFRGGLLPGVY